MGNGNRIINTQYHENKESDNPVALLCGVQCVFFCGGTDEGDCGRQARYLELQRDGLTGHLGEISAWLEKDGNAWLSDGGDHGWEEVPYWLKGYGNLAYITGTM